MKKETPLESPIDDLIASRWSPRAFNPNFFMNKKIINSLFEAARWAPSCYGDQPWKFIAFDKSDATAWSRALNCLSIGNQNWAMDASLLVVACANKNFNHNGSPNRFWQYDTGAAAENLCLQATSMGLSAHQMGGFDSEKIRNLAKVPADFDIMACIAVGEALQQTELSDEQKEKELAPRKRRPLNEIYSINEWKK
jgi:nitroreductase